MKFIVAGVNEYSNFYQELLPDTAANVIIDHHGLMEQLMSDYRTLSYQPSLDPDPKYKIDVEIALISKSTRRYSSKIQWISGLISELVHEFIDSKIMPNPPIS